MRLCAIPSYRVTLACFSSTKQLASVTMGGCFYHYTHFKRITKKTNEATNRKIRNRTNLVNMKIFNRVRFGALAIPKYLKLQGFYVKVRLKKQTTTSEVLGLGQFQFRLPLIRSSKATALAVNIQSMINRDLQVQIDRHKRMQSVHSNRMHAPTAHGTWQRLIRLATKHQVTHGRDRTAEVRKLKPSERVGSPRHSVNRSEQSVLHYGATSTK